MPAGAAEFPVARCPSCARDVLCYFDLDDHDRERACCLECAAEVAPASLRWLDLPSIEELGYGFVLPPAGCGRPDCGNGRCGRSAPEDERA